MVEPFSKIHYNSNDLLSNPAVHNVNSEEEDGCLNDGDSARSCMTGEVIKLRVNLDAENLSAGPPVYVSKIRLRSANLVVRSTNSV